MSPSCPSRALNNVGHKLVEGGSVIKMGANTSHYGVEHADLLMPFKLMWIILLAFSVCCVWRDHVQPATATRNPNAAWLPRSDEPTLKPLKRRSWRSSCSFGFWRRGLSWPATRSGPELNPRMSPPALERIVDVSELARESISS